MVMPPIRMTGAISAITAEKSKYQSSASRTASAMPIATLGDRPACIRSQTAIGKASTIATSIDASPSCRQENVAVAAPAVLMGEEGDGAHHQDAS